MKKNLSINLKNRVHREVFTREQIDDLVFSPDGNWLASGEDKTIKIWDLTTRFNRREQMI